MHNADWRSRAARSGETIEERGAQEGESSSVDATVGTVGFDPHGGPRRTKGRLFGSDGNDLIGRQLHLGLGTAVLVDELDKVGISDIEDMDNGPDLAAFQAMVGYISTKLNAF